MKAFIVSSIIHALVFEDRILDYEDVIGIAKQYDERIVPFIDLAYHEGLDSLCLDDEKSMGYTLRTLGAALWAYWHATSYKEGILKIVLSGGDADTNAAVAGAILGAKFGICHIPDEWKDGLLYASMLHNKVQDLYFYNHRCRWQRGDWTDDTDMMLCISEDCFIRRRCGYKCSCSWCYSGC